MRLENATLTYLPGEVRVGTPTGAGVAGQGAAFERLVADKAPIQIEGRCRLRRADCWACWTNSIRCSMSSSLDARFSRKTRAWR